MCKELLTTEYVVELLKQQVELCGYSQKTVASNFGISPAYLSDVLRSKREPGPKILKLLGLKRVIRYTEV